MHFRYINDDEDREEKIINFKDGRLKRNCNRDYAFMSNYVVYISNLITR